MNVCSSIRNGITAARFAAFMTVCVAWGGVTACDNSAASRFSDSDQAAQLHALGYVDFVEVASSDRGKVGVILHDPERAQPGYNLYNTRTSNRAQLIDMEGEVIHEWYAPELTGTWHHIEMMPSGDLIVLDKEGYIARISWDAEVLWQSPLLAHHDVAVTDSGDVHTLDRGYRRIPLSVFDARIITDYLVTLAADGSVVSRRDVYDLMGDQIPTFTLLRVWANGRFRRQLDGSVADVFHTNSLELIERDVNGLRTKGCALVCFRNLDLIAIVDLELGTALWTWGIGDLDRPHQPSLLDNGNILVFDNGTHRGYSRVIEVNPSSREIVWEYRAQPPDTFFTRDRGGAQGLANGNVLITESSRGRVFEVTRHGDLVWEFFNPDFADTASDRMERGAIYRMTRIPTNSVDALLLADASRAQNNAGQMN